MRDTKTEILDFWFQDIEPSQWFQKSTQFDNQIQSRFEQDYKLASKGIYDGWQDNAKGALALIILLDQFPRNMYRDTPKAFATDAKALNVATKAILYQYDAELSVQEKTFLYLPFEHSENIDDQETSLKLFTAIKDEDPVVYDYARRHYDVIKKFGRFPHRNKILGRKNTKLEEEYLALPDSGF